MAIPREGLHGFGSTIGQVIIKEWVNQVYMDLGIMANGQVEGSYQYLLKV